MEIIYWIIRFLITAWLLAPLFICAYWFCEPAESFWEKHKRITTIIVIGAFLGCFFVIRGGIEPLLWFIPEIWVYETEDDEIMIMRNIIAAAIALAATIFIGSQFDSIQRKRRNIDE